MTEWEQKEMTPNTDEFLKADNTTFHLYDFLTGGISAIGGFQISDVDNLGVIRYYGTLDSNANWVIIKEDTSIAPTTYRYIKGASDYVGNWAGRVGLTYDYYSNVF